MYLENTPASWCSYSWTTCGLKPHSYRVLWTVASGLLDASRSDALLLLSKLASRSPLEDLVMFQVRVLCNLVTFCCFDRNINASKNPMLRIIDTSLFLIFIYWVVQGISHYVNLAQHWLLRILYIHLRIESLYFDVKTLNRISRLHDISISNRSDFVFVWTNRVRFLNINYLILASWFRALKFLDSSRQ